MNYELKIEVERIGTQTLQIACLKDLNQTIDEVFKLLENEGNPQALEELCPYFGVIWPSARGLSDYLVEQPLVAISQKSVLELGCGLALPSMVMARLGAEVMATDFHPEVPRFLNRNKEMNQLKNLSYQAVNWEKESPDLGKFDWVIGSDVLYERRYSQSLPPVLIKQVRPGGTIVIADPGRPYLQDFVDEMKKFGFQGTTLIKKVPHPPLFQEVFVIVFKNT